MDDQSYSPNRFLRARRPERFSDSVVLEGPSLDRSVLEYHLDTLTSRGQETQFERFARRLAEREVCPNLLPQTGPTGGGDSKVDSETYPVADALSLGWYVGIGREAASERWGFAFSAKKKWQAKVRSDIAKMASTGRGYAKAFFVTNQYVQDKTRALIEDELKKAYSIDVRILDRTWILDRVFEHHHETLAVEELCITTPVRHEVRKGPLDTQREQDLEDVERHIQAALQEGAHGFQLVDDCLTAATLARELERPRVEVDGLFNRAERVALQYGSEHQQLLTAYQRAWTALFWYEDYEQLAELYGVTEERAKESRNAYELGLLTNLWLVLHSAIRRGVLNESAALFPERTATLTTALERLSKEQDRASTALQARTHLLQVRLAATPPNQADPILHELRDVVCLSEGLVGYPLEPLAEIVGELGGVLGDLQAYNELFETVIETTARRAGEVTAACAILSRGAQQLDADHPYAAIRTLGRALGSLHNHESRHDLIRALYLCANAYERVGLLWAARGTLLVAASVAANDFWAYEDVTPAQGVCYNRLKWLELQLGRVPHILAWHELDRTITGVLAVKGYDMDRTARAEFNFDAILGILLLRADLRYLTKLSVFPDVLDELGLHKAALALRYALGYTEDIPAEFIGQDAGEQDTYAFFAMWRDQPAARELPGNPELYDGRTVTLNSKVLGCRITVESENVSPAVELAESALAALEALLSTTPTERMMAREPIFTISIWNSDLAEQPFGFEMGEREGRPHVDIRCQAFDSHNMSSEMQVQVKNKLFELLAHILANVFLFGSDTQAITRLFDEGHAIERSRDHTTSFGTIGNVLGYSPKIKLAAWVRPDVKSYSPKRSKEWDADGRPGRSSADAVTSLVKPNFGAGEPPADLRDPEQVRHTDMEMVSLIRVALWDRARWAGTMFLTTASELAPPVLAPIFQDGDAGRQIFAHWRQELGPQDKDERLRVTIIQGIDRSNPHVYRVVIGSNLPDGLTEDTKTVFMVSRSNTMVPTSGVNLQRFLRSYDAAGRYFLAGAVNRDEQSGPVPVSDVHIGKRELNVRNAWQIGRNDPDVVGIREDDDPIIPPGQQDAPVLEVLRLLQEISRSAPPTA